MRRANPQPHPLRGLLRPLRGVLAGTRRGLRRLLRGAARQPGHLLRVLNRLRIRARARRQDKTGNRLP